MTYSMLNLNGAFQTDGDNRALPGRLSWAHAHFLSPAIRRPSIFFHLAEFDPLVTRLGPALVLIGEFTDNLYIQHHIMVTKHLTDFFKRTQ